MGSDSEHQRKIGRFGGNAHRRYPALPLAEIEKTAEVTWLRQFGPLVLDRLVEEELPIARELFAAFKPKG